MKKKIAPTARLSNLAFASSVFCFLSLVQPIFILCQETFYVRGKIVDSHNSAIAGAEVRFAGSKTDQTVASDAQGFYRAELRLGLYSMTVTKASPAYEKYYKRPLFRVSSPRTIVLDVTLYPPLPSCDPGSISVTRPDGTTGVETLGSPDDLRDKCGGWDRLPVYSGENRSFDLFIRYFRRRRSEGKRAYDSGSQAPVLVTFDLFTLTADHVTYNMENRTLVATGNVTTADGTGVSTHDKSVKFKIADDSVQRLRYGKVEPESRRARPSEQP